MSKTGICTTFVVLGVVALGCLTGSCTEDNPCDEGQVLTNGYCTDLPADAAAPAAGPFGQACTTNAECVAPTDYCSIPPGAPGTCTASGCEVNPSICPATWTCLDLTPYGVAVNICIPPSS